MDQTAVSHLKNSPYPKMYCFEHINRTRAFRVYHCIIYHYLVPSTMLCCGRRSPQIAPWALQDVRVTGWPWVLKCSSGPLHTCSCTYCVINKNTCSLYLTSPYGNIWILDLCCRIGNGKARYGSLTLWKCNICSIRKKYICFLSLNLYSISRPVIWDAEKRRKIYFLLTLEQFPSLMLINGYFFNHCYLIINC